MREWISTLVASVLTICAVLVTGMVVRREFFAPPQAAGEGAARIADWRSYAREGHPAGPANAPVKIVVFSDFQCPFCGTLAARLDTLQARYPEEIAILYRHSPLQIHPSAVSAAKASECAGLQGRFKAFHDALFAAQDSIGVWSWNRFALRAEVPDTLTYQRCLAGSFAMAAVKRDMDAAGRLGVTATPTLLINHIRLQGARPLDTLEAHVERALRSASRQQ